MAGAARREVAGRLLLTSSANNLLDTIERVLQFSLEANAKVEIRPYEEPGKVNVVVTGKQG
jgi:hypothetical protein